MPYNLQDICQISMILTKYNIHLSVKQSHKDSTSFIKILCNHFQNKTERKTMIFCKIPKSVYSGIFLSLVCEKMMTYQGLSFKGNI